jgi:putative nucleotidyltransferase with HDIG domain
MAFGYRAFGYRQHLRRQDMSGEGQNKTGNLIERGMRHDLLGEYAAALECFAEAARIGREQGQLGPSAVALRRAGHVYSKMGEWSQALAHYQQSIETAKEVGDMVAMANAMCAMGTMHLERGEWEQVKSCYEKALEIATERKDPQLRSQVLNNLGAMNNILGEWREAIWCYEKSIPLLRSIHNMRGLAETYNNLGMTYRDKDDLRVANRYFRMSLELAKQEGDIRLAATINLNRVEASLRLGELEDARERCEEAFEILNRINDKLGIAEAVKLYGVIYRKMKKYSLAMHHLQESVRINTECENPLGAAEALRELGLLHLSKGDSREALSTLGKSFRIFKELKAKKYLEDVDRRMQELETIYFRIAEAMGEAVESKDTYTYGHSQRVAAYASELAERLGLGEDEKKAVLLAAFLHDLGKVKVPKKILSKPGRLTAEEFAEIEKHPGWGLEKLANVEFPWEVKPLIRHHHERYNGEGYPDRLAGEGIPFGARLISLCDFFDALTTDRPYRPALTIKQAISIMKKEAGTILDPGLTPLFITIIEDMLGDSPADRSGLQEFVSLWNKSSANRMKDVEKGQKLRIAGLAS